VGIVKTGFNGERLKSARLFRRMTIAELAEITDISKQAISQFENKKTEPRAETLFSLSNALGFPRQYFYQEIKSDVVSGDTYFRSLASMTNKDRMEQIERVNNLIAIYRGISEFIEFPDINLYQVPEDFDLDDIEGLAINVREHWGLGKSCIKNIIDVMERNGIIVYSVHTDNKKIDAYSRVERIDGSSYAIVVLGDDKEDPYRRNFSAAHELGHLLLDDFYNLEEMSRVDYKAMEDKMNYFAGALLVPADVYRLDLQTFRKTELSHYLHLKQKYGVSAAALIFRARQLNEITQSQYQYLMRQISIKGYRTREPISNETQKIEPRYIKEAMKMIVEEDKTTSAEFIEVLTRQGTTLSSDIIENVLGLEEGYMSLNDTKFENIVLFRKKTSNA